MNKWFTFLCIISVFYLSGQIENKNNSDLIEMYLSAKDSFASPVLKDMIIADSMLNSTGKIIILDQLTLEVAKNNDYESVYYFRLGQVELGEWGIMLLEDTIGVHLRNKKPNLFDSLNAKSNQSFIEYCLKHFPMIDMELTLMYRHLFRYDQRYLSTLYIHENSSDANKRALITESIDRQNEFTKSVLEDIFSKFGIPGIDLVGPLSNHIGTFFLHIDPEFVLKYASELQSKINQQKLFITEEDFQFIVDKALYRCCGYTIYGTGWSKHAPLKSEDEIIEIKKGLGIE